jgi:anti-sigma factor RsiW
MKWGRPASMSVPREPRCEHVGRVLPSYVDGELGPSDAERVADHHEYGERCGIEMATVERVVGLIRHQRFAVPMPDRSGPDTRVPWSVSYGLVRGPERVMVGGWGRNPS